MMGWKKYIKLLVYVNMEVFLKKKENNDGK